MLSKLHLDVQAVKEATRLSTGTHEIAERSTTLTVPARCSFFPHCLLGFTLGRPKCAKLPLSLPAWGG